MATITLTSIHNKVMDFVQEVTGITNATTPESLTIPTGGKIVQVIITNNSAVDVYMKLWDQGSPPSASGSNWNAEPIMILPAAANETADYTFLGEDLYEFATGWQFNVSEAKGIVIGSSTTLSVDVLIFVT
jgi:hypothetical protein